MTPRLIVPTLLAMLAMCALAASASAAPPSPSTVPGWPKSLPAGPVVQGPSGGLVLVSPLENGFAARAFRRDGTRLWGVTQGQGCGNCDDGPQIVARQPDGTIGPIGYDGDYTWAVDGTGALARACTGVVFPDGSCVGGGSRYAPPQFVGTPVVRGLAPAGGAAAWSLDVPGYDWADEFDVPPFAARDAAGTVYLAFVSPTRAGSSGSERLPGILVAVDPVARAIRWIVEGPGEVLTGLGSGVLVSEGGVVTAYRADGTVAWRRALPVAQRVEPRSAVFDAARGRLYIGRLGGGAPGVTALDAATGAQVWRTAPADRARLMSVGRGGRVYVAIDRAAQRGVRALRLSDARAVWQRRTGTEVRAATELANGTVAVSAGGAFGGPGRLTLLDPR